MLWSQPAEVASAGVYYVGVRIPEGPGKQGLGNGPALGATDVPSANGSFLASGSDGLLTPVGVNLTIDLLTTEVGKASAPQPEPIGAGALRTFLGASTPNPARFVARIEFGVGRNQHARLTIYDARRGRVIKNVDRGEFNAPIGCAFAPDGKSFTLAGMNKNVEVWTMDADVDKIAHKRMLVGHQSNVPSTAWAPDSMRLASASMDGTVKVWDLKQAGDPLLRTLTEHKHSVNSVAWSTDGLIIASGSSDKTIKIWDANTGVCKKTLEGHTEAVTCVAITPDSRIVISASMDRTVKIWDPATGTCLQTLTGHDGPIEAIAISSDGRVLLTGSQDKTIKSWIIGKYPKMGR